MGDADRGPADDTRTVSSDDKTLGDETRGVVGAASGEVAAEGGKPNTPGVTGSRREDWLTRGMRALVASAVAEAARRGTSTVEAEHVLLAIVADPSSPASKALRDVGLDHARLDAALTTERERTLAAVGARALSPELAHATPRATKPTWGASIAAARERSGLARSPGRPKRGAEAALAHAILSAELGTVARALAYAGVDRQALVASFEKLR